MTVLMYDGINALAAGIAREFPAAAKVAGYVNGTYAWSQAEWNLFPHADHVTISVTASANAGDVLDVEAGDATPNQAAGWIAMRKAAGLYRPTIYCSRSVIPAVRIGTGSYVLGRDYDIWVAEYTGVAHEVTAPGLPVATCAATQYASTANYDVSMVYDEGWPHRKPPAPPVVTIPAPAGLSVTPWLFLDVSWATVASAKSYNWEVAQGGKVVIHGTTAGTRVQTANVKPGAYEIRVQADGGEWTAWHAVG